MRAIPAAVLAAILLFATPAGGRDRQPVDRRAKTVRVQISEFAFHPPTLHVKAGTRVVFANDDTTAHTATRGGSFATGHIQPGHAVTVKLRRAGVYAYHCSIHPFMHGKIVVG